MKKLHVLLEDIRVGRKLMLGFGLILFMSTAVALCGIKNLHDISGRGEKLSQLKEINDQFAKARDARLLFVKTHNDEAIADNEKWLKAVEKSINQLNSWCWDGSQMNLINTLPVSIQLYRQHRADMVSEVFKRQRILQALRFKEAGADVTTMSKKYGGVPGDTVAVLEKIRKDLNEISIRVELMSLDNNELNRQAVTEFINETIQFISQARPLLHSEDSITLEKIAMMLNERRESVKDYNASVEAEDQATRQLAQAGTHLTQTSSDLFDQQMSRMHDDIAHAILWMSLILMAAILTGVLIAVFITRQITRPLSVTLHAASQIARGDLNVNLKSSRKDELGELMQATDDMCNELRSIIGNIRSGVVQVSHASEEIASGNNELSSRTEEQASALEETAASMEQLTATVSQNVANIHHTSELARSASDKANSCGKLVKSVVESMDHISASSGKIAEITTVINSIAFQTNILALNAAVEAARAGEQGRGFAVVASEVRSLAQHSAQAAKEIETLIDDSVSRINSGSQLVGLAGKTMVDIVNSVGDVTSILNEITQASDEQSQGISQIGVAIVQMDSVTQQNAALVQESSAAAFALRDQASILKDSVSRFTLP